MNEALSIYLAGELFDLKHIVGNAALGAAIDRISNNRYLSVLPQGLEQRETTAVAIRNQDLATLMACDVGVYNFDGTELDSGTVAEFMFAKMLDIPCVVLRTDFRAAGDAGDVPWNLMLSHYPRTEVIVLDSLGDYQSFIPEANKGNPTASQSFDAAMASIDSIATKVVAALDKVVDSEPILKPDAREAVYKWAQTLPGQSFASRLPDDELANILKRKVSKNLI